MSKRHENIIIIFELEQGNYDYALSGEGLDKPEPSKNVDGEDMVTDFTDSHQCTNDIFIMTQLL